MSAGVNVPGWRSRSSMKLTSLQRLAPPVEPEVEPVSVRGGRRVGRRDDQPVRLDRAVDLRDDSPGRPARACVAQGDSPPSRACGPGPPLFELVLRLGDIPGVRRIPR